MNEESAKKWFIKKFTRDLFLVFAVTWGLMFVMENIKAGIVSNYISLPHLAVLLLVFGIIALSFQPSLRSGSELRLTKKEMVVLAVLSLGLVVLLLVTIEASATLTVLLIFVTLIALWAGTLVLQKKE